MQLGRKRVRDAQPGYGKGLNTTADESQLGETEVRSADNARLTQAGAVEKRLGSQYAHASAIGSGNPVRAGFAWQRAASTTELAIANGLLYTGAYSIGMSWTSQGGSFGASAVPSLAAFRNGSGEAVYIADGTGKVSTWDATTLTMRVAATVAANIGWLCVYNQRLIGGTGVDDTVYASGLNNGDSLGIPGSGGVVAIVRTFGAGRVTAGYPLGASLYLYHVSAISRFTGYTQDDISIASGAEGVSNDVGTIAPRSIVALENMHLFLTDRGVYVATESGVSPVSNPIESTLAALDQSAWARVAAVHNRRYREVWFYIPDVGIYAYNYRTSSWSGPFAGGFISPLTHALWESRDSASRPIVLAGGATGFVKRCDAPSIYKDNVLSDGTGGATFTMTVRMHRMFCGDAAMEKSFRWAYVTADPRGSSSMMLMWSAVTGAGNIALTAPSAIWGGSTWGGTIWGAGSQSMRRPVDARGPYLDLTITDNSGSAQPLVSRCEIEAFALARRG